MKTALLYVTLVGVPLLGLTGILYLGQRLVPPPGVGGTWAFTVGEHEQARAPCARMEAPEDGLELVLSQSGPRLVGRFNDAAQTRLSGRLHAAGIRGRVRGADGCAGNALVQLEAELREEADGLHLVGRLTDPGCACAPVAFVAVRKPET